MCDQSLRLGATQQRLGQAGVLGLAQVLGFFFFEEISCPTPDLLGVEVKPSGKVVQSVDPADEQNPHEPGIGY